MITARSATIASLATLLGCSASPEPPECVAKIAELERDRADYVERTTAELKGLDTDSERATLGNQAKFADFMSGIESRENRIKVERLRCPEARPALEPAVPPKIPVAEGSVK